MAHASILTPLTAAGLTSLRIERDARGFTLSAAREWSEDVRFADYAQRFDYESALCRRPRLLGDDETRALYAQHGAADSLEALCRAIADGRHQGLDCWRHPRLPLALINNRHSNVLGLGNRRHALRAGGIRRHGPEEDETHVLLDGLNLSRAMSFKNAAAQIPYGGSKLCLIAPPIALDDWESLGFIAYGIDRSRSFTGPDMGLLPEHADALRSRFTPNIVGGPGGPLGPTGVPTAYGVLCALRVAAPHHLERELAKCRVGVQGLGAVGAELARLLLEDGVPQLLIADSDPARVAHFLERIGPAHRMRVETVPSDAMLTADVDILSPNAVGGVLGPEEIGALRCRIVMGAANNQLRATSRDGELALAGALADRGVLYQIDWLHNAAGVIAGCEEWEHQQAACNKAVLAKVETVCRLGVQHNLQHARSAGLTPTAAAYQRIDALIYPGTSA